MYKQGAASIFNFLKLSLQELLRPSLSIILIALCHTIKTFLIDDDESQSIIP
jgi:hypothetical protein